MTGKELAALAEANLEINRQGLQRCGRTWTAEDAGGITHDHNTIMSLVEKGCLRLWSQGQVAHITDSGIEMLELELESRK